MSERLKQITTNLKEQWNKFTSKQKALIVSLAFVLVFAFVLLALVVGRVEYEVLTITENTKQASEVIELLEAEGIEYRLGSDQVTVLVDLKSYSDAVLLIASNDMPSTGITVDELLDNSLSTTNSDRTLKLNLYVQNQLRNYIRTMDGVEDAHVYYIPVENTNSILIEDRDTSAGVLLTVNDKFEMKTAETIAEVVASVIGNDSPEKIKIADSNGNLLYGGGRDLYSGTANSNEDFKERLVNTFINNLYMGFIKIGFDDVEIMPNLKFNMDKVTELYTEYLPVEGEEQGVFGHYYSYSSENAGSSGGGIPGTSSNDETDYMFPDSSSTAGSVEIEEIDYMPNERITNTEFEVGAVIPEQSSISIVLRELNNVTEEELEMMGELEEVTFDEYVLENREKEKIEVDPDIYTMVALATGIDESNIQIMAYSQPVYIPKVVEERDWSNLLQIILAILIVVFIFYVVFKGVSPVEVTEVEPELSVEELLTTTQEERELEDIELGEESEIRRMIDKFVDDNPEAAAQLLRNWLNEDWE